MSMLPADIHNRLDPDLIAVPTHDERGLPVVCEYDGVRVRYVPRIAYKQWVRIKEQLRGQEPSSQDR